MTSVSSSTDRIHTQVVLHAPTARVWRALTDMREFGAWFGIALPAGTFTPGVQVEGRVTHPDYAHLTLRLSVEHVQPERLLSFRWHPGATEPGIDYESEPTTLVVFELHPTDNGIMLTVDESGFDHLPPARRESAYRGNEGGWIEQMDNIARHVGGAS
jgi:uncharacterized protein YndB with AHSA1/START domain